MLSFSVEFCTRAASLLGLVCLGLVYTGSVAAAPAIQITSPATGFLVRQGSLVPVTVSVTGGAVWGVALYASDGSGGESVAPPYSIILSIATQSIGAITVRALATDVDGNILATSQPITLDVEPMPGALAQSLQCPLPGLTFVGEQDLLEVFATMSDGSVLRANGSSELTMISQNLSVLTVDGNGTLTATGAGQTTVTGTFAGATCTSPFVVPTAIRADLNNDRVIDYRDLNILLAALNTTDTTAHDARDLNGDGRITIKDARMLASLCGQFHCGLSKIPDDSILETVFDKDKNDNDK